MVGVHRRALRGATGPRQEARKRVLIVYGKMNLYRIPFSDLLRARLDREGVDLQVVYGFADRDYNGAERTARRELPWGTRIDSRIVRVAGRELAWQPCLSLARSADLVIVEQATKRLHNYVLLARQVTGRGAVAFWGHGRNFQTATRSSAAEGLKRQVSRLPHWWFAYTDLSARVVRDLGYPAERITSVQNAIDTRGLVEAGQRLTPAVIERTRSEMGLTGRHVALYCGGMYPEKRPEFLVAVALAARAQLPDFELVVVGDGVSAEVLREAAAKHDWIHFVGPRFDEDKVLYFALAQVCVFPGLIGLGILDSFALETPLIASGSADHNPEIDYLEPGVNGLLVDDRGSPEEFAKAVTGLLVDDEHRARLVAGCRAVQRRYTVEAMAERFAGGVLAALAAPRRGPWPPTRPTAGVRED